METVVLVMILLITFSTWLKVSFMRPWQRIAMAVLCALVVGFSWPIAIEQSNLQIREWLDNQPLMLDVSVLLTVEVLWQMAYCMVAGKLLYSGPVSRRWRWAYRVLRFFPGVLIFPVLVYGLIRALYAFPGVDFATVAWLGAAGVLVVYGAVPFALRWLVPEKELRLEMLFLVTALLQLLGIVATVNGTTQFTGSDPVEWSALAAFLGLALVCALLGWWRFVHVGQQHKNGI